MATSLAGRGSEVADSAIADWSDNKRLQHRAAVQSHQEILENAYRCLSVLIGVFSPFFKQVCCYAPLWRKQVPYDRLEFFLALQNCCNKP